MKTRMLSLLAVLIGMSILISSCKKDEEPKVPASILDLTITDDNAEATVVFNEAVYKNNDKTGNLDKDAFTVTISGGTATLGDYTVSHTAGTPSAILTLSLNGVVSGAEVLKVSPKTETSIYNAAGAGMPVTEEKSVSLKETGIIGKWYSSGTNVAPILISLGIDSVYADFKVDGSYLVESFAQGAKTTLTGNYQQTKSGSGNIWNVTVNQSTPTSLTSQGIFEVLAGNPVTMMYEIAQTEPQIPGVTAPTAEAGFGSTSGGAFGNLNIQNYIRM